MKQYIFAVTQIEFLLKREEAKIKQKTQRKFYSVSNLTKISRAFLGNQHELKKLNDSFSFPNLILQDNTYPYAFFKKFVFTQHSSDSLCPIVLLLAS